MIVGLPPILPKDPHTLILGTMPGVRSLAANQYYAHPRNQFWRLMGDIYGAGWSLAYPDRVRILMERGIAVWDVVHACTRAGSLDGAIRNEVANDFGEFYKQCSNIKLVVFDSATAEKIYRTRVMPLISTPMTYRRVPSPSPANAKMNYPRKLALWAEALGYDLGHRAAS